MFKDPDLAHIRSPEMHFEHFDTKLLSGMLWDNSCCSWVVLWGDFSFMSCFSKQQSLREFRFWKCKRFHNFRSAVAAAQQVHMLLSYNYILIIIFSLGKDLWLTSKRLKQMIVRHLYFFNSTELTLFPYFKQLNVFILCHSTNWMKLLFWIRL